MTTSPSPLVIFQNPGFIPIEAITTLGVNAKDDDTTAIGHFGTGLKYAICIILRLGGSITIYRGEQMLNFLSFPSEIRGKTFNIVHLDNGVDRLQPLGFTTDLGKDWQPWMAYRELESNVRDEQGQSYAGTSLTSAGLSLSPFTTTIIVQCEPIYEAWLNRDEIFLQGKADFTAVSGSEHLELIDKPSSNYYYRGIKAGSFSDEAPFTLNLISSPHGQLTEDRTFPASTVLNAFGRCAPTITSPYFHSKLLPSSNPDFGKRWVDSIDFDWYDVASTEFLDRCQSLFDGPIHLLPHSAAARLRRERPKAITQPALIPITPVQQTMIDTAKHYLRLLGYEETTIDALRIEQRELGGSAEALAVLGALDPYIILAPSCFAKGTKFVCSTLHEEYLHINHHLLDCSRLMQNHLFDKIATLVEEHIIHRPL